MQTKGKYMTHQESITQLTSLIGQKKNEADALQAALDLLTMGFQSDQATIDAAVQAANTNAEAQIQAFKDSVTSILN